MSPLKCDAVYITERSRAERILRRIPVLGWVYARALCRARVRPMVREVEGQLRNRPDTTGEWGGSIERRAVGRQPRIITAEEFGWPNDHFLPTDPLRIVFWAHQDGLDDAFALQRIKTTFQLSLPVSTLQKIYQDGTLDDFLTFLLSLPKDAV